MIRDVAYFSEQGIREINQDSVYVSACGSRGIFVVADGMGGHAGGEIASGAVVNGIRNWWTSNDFANSVESVEEVCEKCHTLLQNINGEVFSYFEERGLMGGTTVVAFIVWDDKYVVLSAGDSRVYCAKDGHLEQLTEDDVWENLPEVKYVMSNEAVVADARYGKLTEALGSAKSLKIKRTDGFFLRQEIFLLCSDGIYKSCPREELDRILCGKIRGRNLDKKAEMLKKCAWKHKVNDNYSAILCIVG